MKILRVGFNGFRGVPDGSYALVNANSGAPLDVLVVTGPPSSGKTSFLEAIIAAKEDVAAYGAVRSWLSRVRPGAAAAKVRVEWLLDPEERERTSSESDRILSESIFGPGVLPAPGAHDPALRSVLGEYDHDRAIGKLEYLHEERSLGDSVPCFGQTSLSEERRVRLTRDVRKYAGLRRFLVGLATGVEERGEDAFDRFAAAFDALCRTKTFAGVARGRGGLGLRFTGAGGMVDFEGLSSSERDALLIAGTFVLVGLERSIVLLDRPELHRPEGDVVRFVEAIAGLATSNQLIVATGSRELVEWAGPHAVLRLG
jgi:hypothetical protein